MPDDFGQIIGALLVVLLLVAVTVALFGCATVHYSPCEGEEVSGCQEQDHV